MVGYWFTVNQNTVAIKNNKWQILSHNVDYNLVKSAPYFMEYLVQVGVTSLLDFNS